MVIGQPSEVEAFAKVVHECCFQKDRLFRHYICTMGLTSTYWFWKQGLKVLSLMDVQIHHTELDNLKKKKQYSEVWTENYTKDNTK